ncbi:MAG: hypothetical protein K6A41_04495 [Bacteroidales bacterium]|nr:hypothetical protein [Bacteroidales bacterium]
MFRIYISAASLERICLEEMPKEEKERNVWFTLLSKQTVLFLDKNIYEELEDYNDPLFTFSESYDINLTVSKKDFNNIINDDTEFLLSEPQGVFLLDIDKQQAQAIQEKYGILCQSTDNLRECDISGEEHKIALFKDNYEYSWKDLFNNGLKVPSNSLIIVDRYIFGWEGKYKSGYTDGIENIKQILRCILPKSLSCDYHVLVLFDENASTDRNYKRENVVRQLDEFIKLELRKPYNIIIELFSVSGSCFNYDATHDRRIISNYFIITVDHLIKAFKNDGCPICNQDLRIEYVYSHGLYDNSSPAVKRINDLLTKFQEMHIRGKCEYDQGTDNAKNYVALCGSNTFSTIHDLRNRLLVQQQ